MSYRPQVSKILKNSLNGSHHLLNPYSETCTFITCHSWQNLEVIVDLIHSGCSSPKYNQYIICVLHIVLNLKHLLFYTPTYAGTLIEQANTQSYLVY